MESLLSLKTIFKKEFLKHTLKEVIVGDTFEKFDTSFKFEFNYFSSAKRFFEVNTTESNAAVPYFTS